MYRNMAGPYFEGLFQGGDDRLIFRFVIGRPADSPGNRSDQLASLILDGNADGRWSGVASGGAIRINDNFF